MTYTEEQIKSSKNILNGAADLIEKGGWLQWQTEDGEGRHCAIGAMSKVFLRENHVLFSWTTANKAVDRFVKEHSDFQDIVHYNNGPGRTADEVINTMRKTAENIEDYL